MMPENEMDQKGEHFIPSDNGSIQNKIIRELKITRQMTMMPQNEMNQNAEYNK